jgi:co-chaperonin GroES (HSP10)
MAKKYLPLGRRVIVDVFKEEELKTDSGIIAGVGARLRGNVVEVGGLVTMVKKGDVILFEPGGAGIPVSTLTPDRVWMEEEQIAAIEVEVSDEAPKE